MAVQADLAQIEPQRVALRHKLEAAQAEFERAREKLGHTETARKGRELEVDSLKQKIEKYSLQQFQTKKNDEYKALAHEIEGCRERIRQQEDEQLELMEQAEAGQKDYGAAQARFQELKRQVDAQLADLAIREENLKRQLAGSLAEREKAAVAVEEGARARYERLLKHKGEKVVVGVDRGVCGGCHMTLPPQVVLVCQGSQELVSCPNCSRLLYYSPEMDLTVAQ